VSIFTRIRNLWKRDALDENLNEELRTHIEMRAELNAADGMSPQEARYAAQKRFGNSTLLKEKTREMDLISWIETVAADVRFGIRTLVKDRGYTAAAVIALALGIGANTALFTLFNSVALQTLPVNDPQKLTELYRTSPTALAPFGPFNYDEYAYIRDHNNVFSGVSVLRPGHLRMSGISLPPSSTSASSAGVLGISAPEQLNGSSEAVMGVFVSASYFSVMGISPVAGRFFRPEEDQNTGGTYPVLLSENFWRRRFSGDPAILGTSVMFSGIPAVIVGITPADFMGTRTAVPDVWAPVSAVITPQSTAQQRTAVCCEVNGRLKPGVTLQQAQANLVVLSDAFHHEHPTADQKSGISVQQAVPYGRGQRGFEIGFAVFQPAIGLVLLIACANVAGLFLGKAATRRREIAVRLAMGASRWRLIRQLVTEGIVVAQIAGALSLLVTWWTLRVVSNYLLSSFSNSGLSVGGTTLPMHLDPNFRVFLYTFVVGIVTGIGFALAPALHSTRLDLSSSLKDEGAAFGSGGKSRFRGWMVAVQIAVCLMLLVGAGMLVRSSIHLLSTNPGFETKSVVNVTILNPLELGYSAGRTKDLNSQLQAKLRSLPGVTQVAQASRVPLGGNVVNTVVVPEGSAAALNPQLRAQAPQYSVTYISPEFFETLGIPVLQGRTFTPQEIASRASVAVVSTGLAQRLWPGQSPLGKRIAIGSPAQQRFFTDFAVISDSTEIVGEVGEIRSVSTIALDSGALYLPRPATGWNGNLLLRTAGDPRTVATALAAEVQSVDSNLSVSFQTLDAMMTSEGAFVATRMIGIVFSIIGSLGLFLASVGIYSMVGYTVSRQTREIGIRMALGAGKMDVLRLILRRSMKPIGAGIIAGIVLGIALSLAVSAIFPGLTLLDPAVILGVSSLLAAIALLAAYIPARRAARVDPIIALRYE